MAWKKRGEVSFLEPTSDCVWLYMPASGALGAEATCVFCPTVLRGRPAPATCLAIAPCPL